MNNVYRLSVLLVILLAFSGCATYSDAVNSFASERERWEHETYVISDGGSAFCPKPVTEVYMVMPEEGKEGTVVVTFNDGREATLHGDYSAMSYSENEQKTFLADEKQMEDIFGDTVEALPPAPSKTQLYFLLGKDELTPESEAEAQAIYTNVLERESPEVIVVGHTDTIGADDANQSLSEQRAEAVKNNLISKGVQADTINASGVGENELAIETGDNVNEPSNRRVEISVR